MRQKVGLAIAIAKDAQAILLDEPTSGLDPEAADEFSRTLAGLAQSGVAVLMTTHDLFRAKSLAHRIGIMRRGRLVRTLAADEIGHADLEQVYLEHMRDQPAEIGAQHAVVGPKRTAGSRSHGGAS
jgi:ABC-2 type transport system ATP-binding protein